MAFSPEPQPAEEPYASDRTLWDISDGALTILQALEYTMQATRRLRQERDDAVEAAHYAGGMLTSVTAELDEAKEGLANASALGSERLLQIRALEDSLKALQHQVPVKQDNRHKLTKDDAADIRNAVLSFGRKVKDVAAQYKVHSSTISRIVNGKAY